MRRMKPRDTNLLVPSVRYSCVRLLYWLSYLQEAGALCLGVEGLGPHTP